MRKFLSGLVAVVLLTSIIVWGANSTVSADTGDTLFINEVMAANKSVIRDGDLDDPDEGINGGAYSDWIEIYNAGAEPADLTGYSLSDSSATWTFPHGTIPGNGYLLIWASDKDKVAAGGQLHTNFKITSSGEPITLKKPDGTVVDSITTIGLEDDQSYGRINDGSAEFIVFSGTTPGSSNKNGIAPVKEPVFSHDGGFYTGAFDLLLSTDEPGVKIYYTKDGSDPVPGAPGTIEYTGGISIKSRAGEPNEHSMLISGGLPEGEVFKCSMIKAAAVRTDGVGSSVVTNSYFVDQDMLTRYDLPIISIVTDKANFFDPTTGIYVNGNYDNRGPEWERPIHMEFFEKDGTPGFSKYCGVRINGEITRGAPQKSLRLYADRGYDDSEKIKYDIFPGLKDKVSGKKITSFKRLLLRNSGTELRFTLFRDALMHSLVSHTNLDTQAYRPSIVFLNGEYWGIYNIRERYDNTYFASHYNLDKDNVAQLEFTVDFLLFGDIEVDEGTPEDAQAYKDDILEYLRSNPVSVQSNYEHIKTKMDVDNYMNYQIANIYFANTDWPGTNVSIWKYKTDDGQYHPEAPYGQDGRWRWMIRDTDFGFGFVNGGQYTDNTLAYAASRTTYKTPRDIYDDVYLLGKFLQNDEFRNQFINRFADHLNTSFDSEVVNKKIDEMKAAIASSIPEHGYRWEIFDDNWDSNVQVLKNFASYRPSLVRHHIEGMFMRDGVTGTAELNLNADTAKGYIKINSIDIKETTPGVTNPEAWTGIYFAGVPVTVKAVPQEGYEFDYWEGVEESLQTSDTIAFNPEGNMNITAVFKTTSGGIICGDINQDGAVDSTDYTVLKRYVLRILQFTDKDVFTAADVNADGEVNSTDCVILNRYILKIIPALPYRT